MKLRESVSVLGSRIARELDLASSNDTLAKWMAYRVAELLKASDNEQDAERKERIEVETQSLIVDLWKHRSTLPGKVDPNKRLEGAIEVLNKLEDQQNHYLRDRQNGDQSDQMAIEAHNRSQKIVIQLILLKMVDEWREWDVEERELPLTEEETLLRKKLDGLLDAYTRPSGVVFVTTEEREEKPKRQILMDNIIEDVAKSIASLKTVQKAIQELSGPNKKKSQSAGKKKTKAKRGIRSGPTKI